MRDSDRRKTVSQDGGGLVDGECLNAKWHQLSGAPPAASTGYGASASEPWHHCGYTADGGRPGHARAARKLLLGGAVGLLAVRMAGPRRGTVVVLSCLLGGGFRRNLPPAPLLGRSASH